MEDLCSALSGSFQVGDENDSATTAHPRYSQYKPKPSAEDQEARRERALALQKSKRRAKADELRNLPDENDDELEDADGEEQMQTGVSQKGGQYYQKPYKNQLMMNEWMEIVPEDFEDNWLFFICPVGKRSLLVAKSGQTRSYSRSGYLRATFHSLLPGGSRAGGNSRAGYALLDSVFVEATRTYYCWDALVWNRMQLRDMDTDFRNCFLTSRFEEIPGIEEHSSRNPYAMLRVPLLPCRKELLRKALSNQNPFEVDGVMFFHKEALYSQGDVSPLVCWLKPHMVGPLIFGEELEQDLTQVEMNEKPEVSHDETEEVTQEEVTQAEVTCSGGAGDARLAESAESEMT